MSELEPKLTPANENPWYVLMTLYGEQEGEPLNKQRHERNRRAWNAWAGQALDKEALRIAAESSKIAVTELLGWKMQGQEIERLYHKVMRTRNGEEFEIPPMPAPEGEIDLSNIDFTFQVILGGMVFPSEVNFRSARFGAYTHFNSATFRRCAQFGFATFKAEANFRSAMFEKSGYFQKANFFLKPNFSSAQFSYEAMFSAAEFEAGANFEKTKFKELASFYKTTFGGAAEFGSSTFSAVADFTSSTFNTEAHFNSSSFRTDTNFRATTFSGFTYFIDTEFGVAGSEITCLPSFRECQFEKPTSFRAAIFKDAYPDFVGATLHDKTTFRAKAQYWPKHPKQSAEEARESCAVIRHNVGNQGLPEDEHFFFRREMLFAGRYGPWPQRLTYQAFGWVSHYGASIARPVRALVTTVIAPAGMFAAALEKSGEGLNLADCFSGLALSFSNTFRLFGFQSLHFTGFYKDNDQILDAVAGAQTILGLVFLFFLGLGLRQRFRLR